MAFDSKKIYRLRSTSESLASKSSSSSIMSSSGSSSSIRKGSKSPKKSGSEIQWDEYDGGDLSASCPSSGKRKSLLKRDRHNSNEGMPDYREKSPDGKSRGEEERERGLRGSKEKPKGQVLKRSASTLTRSNNSHNGEDSPDQDGLPCPSSPSLSSQTNPMLSSSETVNALFLESLEENFMKRPSYVGLVNKGIFREWNDNNSETVAAQEWKSLSSSASGCMPTVQ